MGRRLIKLQIAPSEHLEFHKCFGRFECAKLSLPWDYFNGTYPNHTVSIAITKIPARVPVDDARYGGPILFNPGGPGGPGAAVAIVLGHALQQIVDSSVETSTPSTDARYFDVIGFDPAESAGRNRLLDACQISLLRGPGN